ncbi:hypothetical protein BX600DRAFT_515020 [Xylariales sp. PMI_506]|nr:hypothetical protein BX600DRAFT_515020 [Xylariales sp. PMI_506]
MSDSAEGGAAASDPQVSFKVKTSGDTTHSITMAEAATVLDLKTKLAGSDFENIPVERQRLIYSGRVMKNEEPLSTYKIKAGNTVHLVKSAASNPTPQPPASSSTPAAPQVPTNMAAGTANNPLAGLTGARYAGLTNLPSADMFGPDGGMVGSMMDEDQMANMLQNPMVAQQMNEMINNDQFLDMMIQQNPVLRDDPNARQILRSPLFRNMMTNPEAIRSAARFQRMMRGGGQNAFPAPGVTDTTPGGDAASAGANPATNPAANPFAGMPFNPFAMGLGAQPAATTQSENRAAPSSDNTPATTGQADSASNPLSPPPNPFAALFGAPGASPGGATNPFGLPPMSPDAVQQMMQMMGMGSQNGGSPAPPDNRPPEERYAEQLRQLNDMGFYDFDRNVAALRRSGGSVQGAIEHLLNS